MIDFARDYVAIAVGSSQATTARVIDVGRSTSGMIRTLGQPASMRSAPAGHLGGTTERGRELIAGLMNAELDRCLGALGLVPASEMRLLRQQLSRLERRIGEIRDDLS